MIEASPRPRPSEEPERRNAEKPAERRPERVCPTCGAALLERKCKLLCPDPSCGYYMSCSDFY
ncbi:MAG TPA: hypothetical protein VMQ61_03135 [Thermoanaerobaculia bacterium]|nr:hypothetical protein [Thermoanaerobaculia bacterium]